MNKILIWVSVIFGAISIGFLIWLIKWAIAQIKEVSRLRAENTRLDRDNIYLSAKNTLWMEYRDFEIEASRKYGEGKGLVAIIQSYVEMGRDKAQLEVTAEQSEMYRAQWKQENQRAIEQGNRASEYADQLQQMQTDLREETAEVARLNAIIRQEGLEKYAQSKGVPSASQKPPKGVPKLSVLRPNSVPSASQTHLGGVQDATPPEDDVFFTFSNTHRNYYMADCQEDYRRIEVREKKTHTVVASFDPKTLVKGKAKEVYKSLYVVLCALPDCNAIKLSNQAHIQTCTRDHKRVYDKITKRLAANE